MSDHGQLIFLLARQVVSWSQEALVEIGAIAPFRLTGPRFLFRDIFINTGWGRGEEGRKGEDRREEGSAVSQLLL